MKINYRKIASFLIFLIGLIVLLYPIVSKILSLKNQTVAISHYDKIVANMDSEEIKEKEEKANNYNNDLYENNNFSAKIDENSVSSINLLDNYEVLAHINIPKIDVDLPIYEGTSDRTLSIGVGHIINTSIPCGGENTHSVLVGHTGLSTAKLFDDLDKLEKRRYFLYKMFR